MADEHEMTYKEMAANAQRNVSTTLCRTFDEIAKIAMRASSDFSSDIESAPVHERLKNAHAVVTLIIDQAMRGLGDATAAGLSFVVVHMVKQYEEPEDSSPR